MLRICPVAARLPRPRERLEGQSPPFLLHGQEFVLTARKMFRRWVGQYGGTSDARITLTDETTAGVLTPGPTRSRPHDHSAAGTFWQCHTAHSATLSRAPLP